MGKMAYFKNGLLSKRPPKGAAKCTTLPTVNDAASPSDSASSSGTRSAVRLLQGYLWHPVSEEDTPSEHFEDFDLENYLPHELGEAHLLWDQISPPFAFFENGEPTASQVFYQFTALQLYDTRPTSAQLGADAQAASQALEPLLEATPAGVGWQLWEDLREL